MLKMLKKAIKEHKKKLIEDYLKFDYSKIHVNKFIVDAVFEFEHPTIRTIYKIEEKKSHYEL